MSICGSCGEDNPERARFCLACGAPLEAAPAQAEERKVVSVLFVDLVGFTASSDRADPEDVRARLRPYHGLLKGEIERYGGTVEKFIGDAVMAVFGAPLAHEDDAERAVRAALRIVEAIPELNEEHPGLELSVRAAVDTGEAVVSLGARPERGEGIATGDVVNTASLLQRFGASTTSPRGGRSAFRWRTVTPCSERDGACCSSVAGRRQRNGSSSRGGSSRVWGRSHSSTRPTTGWSAPRSVAPEGGTGPP